MCRHLPYALICQLCNLDDLIQLYLDAKRHYYAGEPIMTDTAFDYLETQIRGLDPSNPVLEKVGADT